MAADEVGEESKGKTREEGGEDDLVCRSYMPRALSEQEHRAEFERTKTRAHRRWKEGETTYLGDLCTACAAQTFRRSLRLSCFIF